MTRALGLAVSVLAVAVLVLASAGCVTAQIQVPTTDAARLERTLTGEKRFLRVSMYQTPFFGDATRKLLTPLPPSLVRLLEKPDHTPLTPGAVEQTWPAGARVTITRVDFPTALSMTERVLYTPRSLVWLTVQLEDGPKNALPTVVVLRPGIHTADEFMAELDKHLTREDPTKQLEAFGDAVRDAVKAKKTVPDMPAEALEMSWGFPESKKIELEGATRRETWKWGEGGRTALLVDGKLTSASDASSSSSP
ncbi:MAG: hypothetical protein U0228_27175 [Myxococcaceae bacterium]